MVVPDMRLLGQFSTAQAVEARRLAAVLNRRTAGRAGGSPVVRVQAVVVSVGGGSPPTCTVDFGGGGVAAGVGLYEGVTPVVGRVVEVEVRSGNPVVVGILAV